MSITTRTGLASAVVDNCVGNCMNDGFGLNYIAATNVTSVSNTATMSRAATDGHYDKMRTFSESISARAWTNYFSGN